MDRNCLPDYVEPSAKQSLEDTQALISYIQKLNPGTSELPPLVQPILTPRFAISSTPELLDGVGKIYSASSFAAATASNNHHHPPFLLQTHIAENPTEVRDTVELFSHLPPPSPSVLKDAPHHRADSHTYASIYEHYGLLGDRTILAHGVYLSDGEIELIKARGSGISHCAGSNFNLRSGVASVGKWLDAGVKVHHVSLIAQLN